MCSVHMQYVEVMVFLFLDYSASSSILTAMHLCLGLDIHECLNTQTGGVLSTGVRGVSGKLAVCIVVVYTRETVFP